MPWWESASTEQRLARSAVVAVVGALVLFDVPLCPSASVLGVPCPGCGLTRATWALLRGDVARALSLHPLVLVVVPALAALGVLALLSALTASSPKSTSRAMLGRWFMSQTSTVLGAAFLALLLVVWACRFFGWFGGPVPVESFAAWWRGQIAAS